MTPNPQWFGGHCSPVYVNNNVRFQVINRSIFRCKTRLYSVEDGVDKSATKVRTDTRRENWGADEDQELFTGVRGSRRRVAQTSETGHVKNVSITNFLFGQLLDSDWLAMATTHSHKSSNLSVFRMRVSHFFSRDHCADSLGDLLV